MDWLKKESPRETILVALEFLSRSAYWRLPFLRKWRELRAHRHSPSRQECSYDELVVRLGDLGVGTDCTLVHSGLSGLEIETSDRALHVEPLETAEIVLAALFEVAGSKGTLVLPTNARYQHDGLASTIPVFDPQRTPCGVGLVNELFRRKRGVKRSKFPFNPVAAFGPQAEELLDGNLHDGKPSPHGLESPYYRICQNDGLILSLGVRLKECLTLAHVVEETRTDWPISGFFEERDYDIREGGVTKRWTIRQRCSKYAQFHYCRQKMARDLVASKVIHEGSVGTMKCDWARAADIYRFFVEKTDDSPYPYFGLQYG